MPDHNNISPYNGNGNYNGYNGHGLNGKDKKHDEDEIDLKHLFYLLWGHKWVITSAIVAGVALAVLAASLKTPIYKSTGSIMITSAKNSYSYAGSDLANLLTSSYGIGLGSSVSDELQILKSRSLSMQIADTLMEMRWMKNGEQYPILYRAYPDIETMTSQDTVAARLRARLNFTQVNRESNLIEISFESPAPLEAADVVNFTIEEYAEYSTRQNRKAANAAVQFLANERERIKDNLQKAALRLQAFMDESNLVQLDAQTEALIKQRAELEMLNQEAQSKLTAVNAAINQYNAQLDSIKPGLAEQFASALGPNMKNLQYQLSELKIKRALLLSKNPKLEQKDVTSPQLQQVNRQIAYFKDEIKDLTAELLSQNEQYLSFIGGGSSIVAEISKIHQKLIELKVEQQQYSAQVDALTKKIDNIEEIFNSLPENMTDLARLKRTVAIYEQMYITVSGQLQEMSLWKQTQFGQGQLVDSGYVPGIPIEPNTNLYLLVGFVLGGILGVGYVFVKEAFNTSIDGVNKLKEFDAPVLSVIPDIEKHVDERGEEAFVNIEGRKISARLITYLNALSPFSEAYRRLESSILHSNPDSELKSIVVTSTSKGEGKTTTSSNLGVVMAEAGQRVVIVDTDLRRHQVHHMFGVSRTPGIVDVLFDNITLDEAIKPTVVPNLSVVTAGQRSPNPSAIIKSSSFRSLIKELENRFDRVIIDTAPFGIITDAAAFMSISDGVVVVTRFKKTQTGEVEHTFTELHKAKARILGTVLNGFEPDKSSDYYYGQSYYKQIYQDYKEYTES